MREELLAIIEKNSRKNIILMGPPPMPRKLDRMPSTTPPRRMVMGFFK